MLQKDDKQITHQWKRAIPTELKNKREINEILNDPNINSNDKLGIMKGVISLSEDEENKFKTGIFANNNENTEPKNLEENRNKKTKTDKVNARKILERLKKSKLGNKSKQYLDRLIKLLKSKK